MVLPRKFIIAGWLCVLLGDPLDAVPDVFAADGDVEGWQAASDSTVPIENADNTRIQPVTMTHLWAPGGARSPHSPLSLTRKAGPELWSVGISPG